MFLWADEALMNKNRGLIAIFLMGMTNQAVLADHPGTGKLRAVLSTKATHVVSGVPIWIDFVIHNDSDEPAILSVPGTEKEIGSDEMGLPISHVFSGVAFAGLTIRSDTDRTWSIANGYQPPAKTQIIAVAPHSSVGATIDIRHYYAALRTPGNYRLTWAPYEGAAMSGVLLIRIGARKQAEILTDHGTMTLRFLYDEAPEHVANFLELARRGFYNNLTFHRIYPGYFIQGGCPNGDGTGIRPDGIKLEAEITDRPQTRGSVSMALADDDPDSGSTQFFITNTRVPEWDGKYTIFAELIGEESFETLDSLMVLPLDESSAPLERVSIRSIRISDVPRQD
jgi:peptidyl-prolyl cis-trans isomerase B (cyclophilin B)